MRVFLSFLLCWFSLYHFKPRLSLPIRLNSTRDISPCRQRRRVSTNGFHITLTNSATAWQNAQGDTGELPEDERPGADRPEGHEKECRIVQSRSRNDRQDGRRLTPPQCARLVFEGRTLKAGRFRCGERRKRLCRTNRSLYAPFPWSCLRCPASIAQMGKNNSPGFFTELKRRNVYKVAVACAVVGWLLVQVATQVFHFSKSRMGHRIALTLALGFT